MTKFPSVIKPVEVISPMKIVQGWVELNNNARIYVEPIIANNLQMKTNSYHDAKSLHQLSELCLELAAVMDSKL